jgi:hypothetical protein
MCCLWAPDEAKNIGTVNEIVNKAFPLGDLNICSTRPGNRGGCSGSSPVNQPWRTVRHEMREVRGLTLRLLVPDNLPGRQVTNTHAP